MGNVWSYIVNQKHKIAFVIFIFVALGIFSPTIASASWYCIGVGIVAGPIAEIPCEEIIGGGTVTGLLSKIYNIILDIPHSILATFIRGVADALQWIFYHISVFSSQLFLTVLSSTTGENWAITKSVTSTGIPTNAGSVFLGMWNIVKDWANMLVVLGMVATAIIMILRLEGYNTKKLLVDLIIAALLVNFSIVFVGVIIDTSNIIMNSFTRGNIATQQTAGLPYVINKAWNNTLHNISNKIDTGLGAVDDTVVQTDIYFGLSIIFYIMYSVVAATMIWLTFIFVERYVMLAILFILSPIVFVFRVLPIQSAKNLWGEWWKNFIKYCFIGLAAAFFLRISAQIIMVSDWNVIPTNNKKTIISLLVPVLFKLIIAMGFLIAGLKITKKSAGRFATFAVGRFATFAVGAFKAGVVAPISPLVGAALLSQAAQGKSTSVVKTAKNAAIAAAELGVGAATGNPAAIAAGVGQLGKTFKGESVSLGQATRKLFKDKIATPLGEKFFPGFIPPGTAQAAQEEELRRRIQPHEKAANARGSVENAKDIKADLTDIVATGRMNVGDAAKLKQLHESGNLSMVTNDRKKLEALGRAAEIHLSRNDQRSMWDNFAKQHAELAPNNKPRMEELAMKNPGKTKAELESMAVTNAYVAMPEDKEFKKLGVGEQISRFKATVDPSTGKTNSVGSQMIDEMAEKGNLGKLAKVLGGIDKLADQINYAADEFGANTKKALLKLDPRLAGNYQDQVNELLADKGIAATPEIEKRLLSEGKVVVNATPADIQAARKELIDKEYSRIGAREINDMDDGALNIEFIKNTTAKKISKADNLSKSKIQQFKKMLSHADGGDGDLEDAIFQAQSRGDIDMVSDLEKKYQAIRLL